MRNNRTLFATFLMVIGIAGLALAANPHFITANAIRVGNDLVVSFKEAGLGNNQSVTIEVSAHATAEYWCINKGGKNPSAANKRTVESQVAESGEFRTDKNGSVTGRLTLSPPDPDFECPPGQTAVLQSVTYTDVAITDVTNNVTEPIGGTF